MDCLQFLSHTGAEAFSWGQWFLISVPRNSKTITAMQSVAVPTRVPRQVFGLRLSGKRLPVNQRLSQMFCRTPCEHTHAHCSAPSWRIRYWLTPSRLPVFPEKENTKPLCAPFFPSLLPLQRWIVTESKSDGFTSSGPWSRKHAIKPGAIIRKESPWPAAAHQNMLIISRNRVSLHSVISGQWVPLILLAFPTCHQPQIKGCKRRHRSGTTAL